MRQCWLDSRLLAQDRSAFLKEIKLSFLLPLRMPQPALVFRDFHQRETASLRDAEYVMRFDVNHFPIHQFGAVPSRVRYSRWPLYASLRLIQKHTSWIGGTYNHWPIEQIAFVCVTTINHEERLSCTVNCWFCFYQVFNVNCFPKRLTISCCRKSLPRQRPASNPSSSSTVATE